ncbi:MAG: hypothetical protein Q7S31_03605 [bacterium]|nr:hypothetical protein [bacterium]
MKRLFLVMVILLLPAVTQLMRTGYYPMHDDLQAMRQLEMDKCFTGSVMAWQFPCRWVTDMGYGYGYPLFNFYPPLPYYFGQLVHLTGFSFIGTVKVMGIIGFAASLVTMYLLAAEFWGRRGGMLAALFYLYAPYHSTDFYVRAAINEFWALVWYPLIYWVTYKMIKEGKRWIPWVAMSVAALMLSHNPMLMIFAPTYLVWIILWWIKFRSVKSFGNLALSAVWAFGLAAFFTLPVILEAKYVSIWTLTSGYFNYLAHFLDWRQMLLKINWGYGESVFGPNDTMSFAVGYLHWIVPALIVGTALAWKKMRQQMGIILFLAGIIGGTLFMMHWKATPIWQRVPPLEFLQFPWRLLTLTIFAGSFLSGAAVLFVPKKWLQLFLAAILTLLLVLNANYFRPHDWWPWVYDAYKFSGELWRLQTTAGIFDYLPKWAPFPPADGRKGLVEFAKGSGTYKVENFRSNFQQYTVDVATGGAVLEIQTYYFPGWRVWLDKGEVAIDPYRDPVLGRMRIDATEGRHYLIARFTDTPVRMAANAISLLAWVTLILYFVPWPKRLTSRI